MSDRMVIRVVALVAAAVAFQRSSLGAIVSQLELSIDDRVAVFAVQLTDGIWLSVVAAVAVYVLTPRLAVLAGFALLGAAELLRLIGSNADQLRLSQFVLIFGGLMIVIATLALVVRRFDGPQLVAPLAVVAAGGVLGAQLASVQDGLTRTVVSVVSLAVLAVAALLFSRVDWGLAERGSLGASIPAAPGLVAAVALGLVWGIITTGSDLSTTLSFLAGFDPAGAEWLLAASILTGGFLAALRGISLPVFIAGGVLAAWSALMADTLAFGAYGAVIGSGLATGPLLEFAGRRLSPGTRAIGFGLFYVSFSVAVRVLAERSASTLADEGPSVAGQRLAFLIAVAMVVGVVVHRTISEGGGSLQPSDS